MSALRATVRVPLRSPLADATARDAALELEGFPLGRRWLLRCSRGSAAVLQDLPLRIVPGTNGATGSALVEGCRAEERLLRRLDAAGAVPVPPVRWRGGAVEVALVLADGAALPELTRRVPGLRLLSKQRVASGLTPDLLGYRGLLPDLTKKQAEALLAAQRLGYYESPRRADAGDLARHLGIARSTFEEHLKRAEAQLVGALAPVVRLHAREEPHDAEALQTYARFSEALGLYVLLAVRGDRVARVKLARQRPPKAGKEHPYLARILDHLATGKDDLRDIPVDLDVSPFEREVLEALRRIPPGEVRTYGELARALGHPGAARAVGNACAKNPLPLVIPCHRVVPGSGGLGNYSAEGGPATKERLLVKEGAIAARKPGRRRRS